MIDYVTGVLFRGRTFVTSRKQPVLIYAATVGRWVPDVMTEQLASLQRRGCRVMLMCEVDDETRDRAVDGGIELIPLPARRVFLVPQGIRTLLFAISTFRRIKPELVCVVAADAAFAIGLASWVSRVPSRVLEPAVHQSHNVVVPEQRTRRRRRGAGRDAPVVRR